MRFIRGESLSDAIRQFHKKQLIEGGKRSNLRWGFEFRQLLGRFLDVCDAIDYAHSRGVIHRDIKPANIMLGRFGETLVVDWGLAKVMGKPDIAATRADGYDEPSMAESAVSFSGETQPGTMIGTPSYMSPEQARGEIEEIGTRSDVYSLGVTLYELLTGRVAFNGDNATAVIEKVLRHEFRAPRSIFGSMPPALEAICLKAMAAQPAHRYASVRELARDIEHWLADEPTGAYVERPLERTGRWIRQHRTWTSGVAASLVGLTLASVIAAFMIDSARRRETEAREDAETNFALSRQAVEDYFTTVSEDTLLNEQDSLDNRNLRLRLLRTALPYYKRFVQKHGDDPTLRRQLALSFYRIGVITREIGSDRDARDAFASALDIWQKESKADPRDELAQYHVALSHLAVGIQDAKLLDRAAAMKSFNLAMTPLEALAKSNSLWPEYESSLADCYAQIGILQGHDDSTDRGLDMLNRSCEIEQKLATRFATNPDYQKSLIEKINAMGFVHYQRKMYGEALKSFEEVRAHCELLLAKSGDPKPVKFREMLAVSLANMSAIHWVQYEKSRASGTAELEAAEKAAQDSLEQRVALVKDQPSVTKFRTDLALSYDVVSRILDEHGKKDDALNAISQAVRISRELVAQNAEGGNYEAELTRLLGVKGFILDKARANREALKVYAEVLAAQKRVLERSTKVSARILVCKTLEDIAEQFLDLGDVSGSLEPYQELVPLRRELVELDPANRDYVKDLAKALSMLAKSFRLLGKPGEAASFSSMAGDAWKQFRERTSEPGGSRTETIQAMIQSAAATTDLGKPGEASAMLVPLLPPLLEKSRAGKADYEEMETLSEALWELARAHRLSRQVAEAELNDSDRLKLWATRPVAELARLAAYHLSRAMVVGYGKISEPEPVAKIRELELDRGGATLALAIGRGLSDLSLINSTPEGSPLDGSLLLTRPDVKSAIEKMPDSKQAAMKPGTK